LLAAECHIGMIGMNGPTNAKCFPFSGITLIVTESKARQFTPLLGGSERGCITLWSELAITVQPCPSMTVQIAMGTRRAIRMLHIK
jgi:hypothetical protein